MNFVEYLETNNLTGIMNRVDYVIPNFIGRFTLVQWFRDIVENNKTVFVYGDYDVDGLMSLCIWKDTLKDLNVSYKCYKYKSRTHNLDYGAVHECIAGSYDYMIITDTGSSTEDYKSINMIRSNGTKVIVIDHHETRYKHSDYGDDVLFINSTIDYRINLTVSGGVMSFICASAIYDSMHRKVPVALSAYALTSLYSDCIDMSNDINRSIYYMATNANLHELPATIKHFMRDYDSLNKRYITFSYSPRINALFRAELFDVLNNYLIEPNEKITMPSLLNHIENVYSDNRDMVNTMTDIVVREELDNFVVANLSSVKKYLSDVNNIQNYTGLVANHLSSMYNKPCVTYYGMSDGTIKGSFRDVLNRPLLDTFRTFCDANGHKAAFGIKLGYKDFDSFYKNLKKLDTVMSKDNTLLNASNQGMVSILDSSSYPDIDILNAMSHYNEFAGDKLPVVAVQRVHMGGKYKRTSYYHMYKWGDLWYKSSSPLIQGSVLRLLPVKRKKLELRVLDHSKSF